MKILLLKKHNKAFILPLTLLITTIILAVATGITTILLKQMLFSRLSRESHTAYYSADTGLSCAVYIDDAYINQSNGIGIFEYDPADTSGTWSQLTLDSVNGARVARVIPVVPTLNNIICATTPVFNVASSSMATSTYLSSVGLPIGVTTIFNLTMDLGDGTTRCAEVTVNKTATFRQIISRGFNTCNKGSSNFIERAVVNTTENN